MFLASCLQHLQLSIFYNDNLGISHVAYVDDVLLLSRTKHSLITNCYRLSATLSNLGFSVNFSKCEFQCFGSPPPASPLCLGSSTISCSASIKWLGLFFPRHFRLLAPLLRPACWKVCGFDTRKFHQIVVGLTEKDYSVFILVFVPLLFLIFLVLLSSFARRIQRKYAQDILSIASICCVSLGGIGIIQSSLNLTSLMRPRDWNIYLKIYVLKLGKWSVFLTLFGQFWMEVIYLCCMLLCCYVIYVVMFFVLFFLFLCVYSTV